MFNAILCEADTFVVSLLGGLFGVALAVVVLVLILVKRNKDK